MQSRELEIIMGFPRVVHMSMRKMTCGFQSSLKAKPLSDTLQRTLMFLFDKGPLTMTQLHHMVGLEKGSLTSVIDRLIELGFVERSQVAGDRRKVNIVLTDLGRDTSGLLRMEVAKFIRGKLDKLSAEDRERFYQAVEVLNDISGKL